jgi:hypothetical protein
MSQRRKAAQADSLHFSFFLIFLKLPPRSGTIIPAASYCGSKNRILPQSWEHRA